MTYYLKNGSSFDITKEENIDIRTELPVGTYAVMASPNRGYYLEQQQPAEITHKVYGTATKRADRVINTFADRPGSTGVILQGEKGSGKTMLAKLLSVKLREQGVITILINSAFSGEGFNNFLSSIEQPSIVIFDEFEKLYNREQQNALLTLLDGTHNSKKLFVVTLNDYHLVNDFMKNRPGRFYYSFKYEGLEEEFVQEYCEDNLNDKSKIGSVVNFSSSFNKFNFDMLKAIVEEMNRYNESIGEAVSYLNVKPADSFFNLDIVSFESEKFKDWTLESKSLTVNPMASFTVFLEKHEKGVKASSDMPEPVDYNEITFGPADLKRMANGRFIFQSDVASITLEKKKEKKNALEEFYRQL